MHIMSANMKFNAVAPLLCILLASCERSAIEGAVNDPFARGLAGVSVQIEKSTYQATSDDNGRYSIEYAPGAFALRFSKSGYTTSRIDLNLQDRAKYPAQQVVLYPIPKDPGIYYIGPASLIRLDCGTVRATKENDRSSFLSYIWSYDSPFLGNLVLPAGSATFVDTIAKPLTLNKPRGSRLYEGLLSMAERRDSFNGFDFLESAKPVNETVGEEKLPLRTIDLKPGQYAWTQTGDSMGGKPVPQRNGVVCPFQVSPLVTSIVARANNAEPSVPFVDFDACQGEGCSASREWIAKDDITIFVDFRPGSATAFTAKRGDKLIGQSGVVVTSKIGRATATRKGFFGGSIAEPGEVVFLLANEGEGFMKAWFKGRYFDGLNTFTEGLKDELEPESHDWVKVKNAVGQVGWTDRKDLLGRACDPACGN